MVNRNLRPESRRLQALLKQAGFKPFRMEANEHVLLYSGRTRDRTDAA